MHPTQRVLAVLLSALLLTSLGACRGRRVVASGPAYSGPVVVSQQPGGPGAPVVPGQPVVPGTSSGADPALDEARADAKIADDKAKFLAGQHLVKAREAMAAGNIEAAREAYGRALEADPTNAEAKQGWTNLSLDRPSTVQDYFEQQRSVNQIRRQEAVAQVRNHLAAGRALESREDFAGAVAEYQKALAIVSWYDDTSDFGTSSAAVQDLIDNARYKATIFERRQKEEALRAAHQDRERERMAERDHRLGLIRTYFDQANIAFRRGDYTLARSYAQEILRIDPTNRDAEKLVAISYDAENIAAQGNTRREFDDQWKRMFQEMERNMLPQVPTVVFPTDWLDGIAHRRPKIVGDELPADEAGTTGAIYEALRTKRVKNLQWSEETKLVDAIGYLRTITGLNFYLTPKAQTDKAEATIPLQVDDVSVVDVLNLITSQNGMKWEVRDGLVRIAMADEVSGSYLLRYFDINDLQVKIPSFIGQEINLVPSNFTPPEPPELAEPVEMFAAESLQDLIKETIGGPDAWNEPATLEAKKGVLIARNTPELLDQVQKLLDELRANTGLLVNLEVRFLTAEDNFLRDVGVDVRGLGLTNNTAGLPGLGTTVVQNDVFFGSPSNPYGTPFGVFPEPSSVGTARDAGIFYNDGQDGQYSARVENLFDVLLGNPEVLTGSGGLSFQHTFLDDAQLEVILRAVEKSERVQNITSPRITVYNTQRANIQVLNQVSYVQDYEVEIAQASNIANPVIQTIQDGIVLDVRPVVSSNRKFVTLELRPTVAVLTRPIATFSTSLASGPIGANAPVVIQIPELRVSRVRTTVSLPDKGTLLLGGLKFYEQETLSAGVPILSDIPVLSLLFSRKGHYVNRRNLLVLIHAEIVPLEELQPRGMIDLKPLPMDSMTWESPAPPVPLDCVPVKQPCPCK